MKNNLFLLILILALPFNSFSQQKKVTISGTIHDKISNSSLPFVNVILKIEKGNQLVFGTVTDDKGRFVLSNISSGNYNLEISYIGYSSFVKPIFVGSISDFLDLGILTISEDAQVLNEVVIKANTDNVTNKMDKKVFSVADNVSQTGGSVLQSMQNLPGITIQDGKVQLRGNDKITVLIDGKQTALTGFGNQSGLDNIPASAIDKIEIINNPSSKYDANGNAGIINIIYKKNKKEGFNGKVGFTSGLGALWEKKENLPTIRPQYQLTPKINPSLAINYKKEKLNFFLQADNLYTETLNKNEFVTRTYSDGTIINQQLKRNRNTNFFTSKAGVDWQIDDKNSLTVSTLFGSEKIIDRGDQPFFNADYSQRNRLWQFLEDELKTTVMATATFQHKFEQPGHLANFGFNYTFHREDEKYFFDNLLPTFSGNDSFKLLSDEKVADFTIDYVKPLKYGKLETGIKLRKRDIPTNMQFFQGLNSPLDADAGGEATYKEFIPAVYGNYNFETEKWEAELGLRLEYMDLKYDVNPNHNTYKSDGYTYFQPFPTMRLAYKISDNNKLSAFYNRRVD